MFFFLTLFFLHKQQNKFEVPYLYETNVNVMLHNIYTVNSQKRLSVQPCEAIREISSI